MLQKTNGPVKLEISLNDILKFKRIISQADENARVPPEHLPENIHNVISEGNRCLSIGCWNAASAMYRLALDLATKEMLPSDGEPSSNIRKSLGLRVKWLFDKGIIADELRPLAECIQQDGNDGVHDGNLSEVDADDLHDFSFELLKKIYSDAKRVEIAKQRRLERRGSLNNP